ncbi:DUF3048 domain-containing protein [Flexivirga alba]|uniref:DUF3048 domain-containing protein n=1 Tax=Flexivirga alba TaxID=702742 RepID=A0ABW2AJN2_9MICO
MTWMKQRRRLALTAGIAVLALTAGACSSNRSGGSAGVTASRPSSQTASSPVKSPAATASTSSTPAAKGDPLTGGKKTGHPVIAVKLENTAAAMPQYGLSPADLVFVEQVEGNLTRLMPVYQSSYPSRVEPVRSARSTDVDILPAFGRPALVYSGAASQIRTKLSKAPIKLYGGNLRDSSRPAPHNLYLDVATLSKRQGLSTSKDIGLRFAKTDPRLAHAKTQTTFTVKVGGDRFSFAYKGTHYLPSWNGRPYTDSGAGGKRVTASNVLVLSVRTVSDHYRDPAGNPVYKSLTTGSGKLTIYRNGKELSGTWHRPATNKPFRFTDDHDKELRLTPGKTWILLQD